MLAEPWSNLKSKREGPPQLERCPVPASSPKRPEYELDKALDQFYEKGLKERQNALHSINKAVCKMINS